MLLLQVIMLEDSLDSKFLAKHIRDSSSFRTFHRAFTAKSNMDNFCSHVLLTLVSTEKVTH